MPAKPTDRITVRIPTDLIHSIDTLVEAGQFRNRTDVVFQALKDFVKDQGTAAKETIEAERGMLELKKLMADMQSIKKQVGLE